MPRHPITAGVTLLLVCYVIVWAVLMVLLICRLVAH